MQGLVAVIVILVLALGGYSIYRCDDPEKQKIAEQARQIEAQKQEIAEQQRVISELGVRLDRVWSDQLVADLRVDRLEKDPGGQQTMHLTFVQYEPGSQGEKVVLRKSFSLPGDEVYVDALVVQFERELVEGADGLRGKSLLLFRRAFGDRQQPSDGVPLFHEQGGSEIPRLYRVDDEASEFEQKLWSRFWELANDPKAAAAQGVRVAQGEAPHVEVTAGQVYELRLRASGGLEIRPRLPAALLDE
jgi:hypothetical protein